MWAINDDPPIPFPNALMRKGATPSALECVWDSARDTCVEVGPGGGTKRAPATDLLSDLMKLPYFQLPCFGEQRLEDILLWGVLQTSAWQGEWASVSIPELFRAQSDLPT